MNLSKLICGTIFLYISRLSFHYTKLSYHSEILKELHLLLRAVGREATKPKESCKLSRVVLRVEDKDGRLDVGVGILKGN